MTRRQLLLALLAPTPPAFSGTFLQLTASNRDWSSAQWTGLFDDFARLGLSRVIIQWTEGFVDFLPLLFEHASRAQMRVELGLINEPRFWHEAPAILGELRQRSREQARLLNPFAARPEFAGWYITEEIDDVRWRDKRARKELGRYLKDVRKRLKNAPVRISAFSNGAMPPYDCAHFLRELLRESGIDGILFQDSIGARKLTLETLPAYYSALRSALGSRVEPVVEIFDQVKADPFEARPADTARIKTQLEIVRAAGFGSPIVFSVPEYRTPDLFAAFAAKT